MIKFMVIGPPRSGTAWASVWLNAYHDPLWDFFYKDLDNDLAGSGVCCTGLGMFPDWVDAHPAPKVILHRDQAEVNASLTALGLPHVDPKLFHNLEQISGLHVHWTELFKNPRAIWDHIHVTTYDEGFSPYKHKHLKMLKITTDWQARQAAAPAFVRKKYADHGILVKV